MISDYNKAHTFSSCHRDALEKDKLCGCFYCLEIFSPTLITEWVNDKSGDTAICPYCNIDSIIGQSSGFPITKEFLLGMHHTWFSD